MTFTERVDVLDLLIHIFEEHEKRLDELITRLEAATKSGKESRD